MSLLFRGAFMHKILWIIEVNQQTAKLQFFTIRLFYETFHLQSCPIILLRC
ncbi:MAG: hypothetical protein ACI8PW_000220 [Methylophilaceae bacterium]|jgi:hypothetical protein